LSEKSNKPETKENDDPLIGNTFADRYEVISLLGRGGMSIVYKARHLMMNKVVALKVLLKQYTADEQSVMRFRQEARASSSLSHQNIITVHDFGVTAQGEAFLVMDYLRGKSLGEIIEEEGNLPLDRCYEIFLQTFEGLKHAHRERVVHRDLKPSNIMVSTYEDGEVSVKIVDFGIAKMLPKDDETSLC